jgi:PAS domain S-box-containing protein
MKNRLLMLWGIFLLTVVNLLGTQIGTFLVIQPGNISALWPPAGIAFAALFIFGGWLWPGIFIASFIFNFNFLLQKTGHFSYTILIVSCVIGLGSVLQAFLGVTLARLFLKQDKNWSLAEFLKALLMAGPASCTVAAAVGVSSLWVGGLVANTSSITSYITWWFGDSVGVLVIGGMVMGSDYFLKVRGRILYKKTVKLIEVLSATTVVLCLLITLFSWRSLQYNSDIDDKQRFGHLIENSTLLFLNQIDSYEEILRSTAGFIMSSQYVNREEWKTYVSALNIEKFHNSLYGIGYIVPVLKSKENAYLDKVRKEQGRSFSIKTLDENPLDERYVIQYIEPFSRNEVAWGLDIASEQHRREAAQFSRTYRQPRLSKSIHITQDPEKRPGYLLVSPVFRYEAFVGWVYTPFSAETLFDELSRRMSKELMFEVYEGSVSAENLVYSSKGKSASFNLKQSTSVKHLGADWIIVWKPTSFFQNSYFRFQAGWVLVFGLSLTILLIIIMLTMASVQSKAEELTKKATEELSQTNLMLMSLIDHAVDSIIAIDHDNNVTLWNPASETMFGYTKEEVMGKNVIDFVIPPQLRHPDLFKNKEQLLLNRIMVRRGYRKSGAVFPIELSFFLVGEGESAQLTSFTRDISERIQAEQELRWAKHHAEKSAQAKSEFLAMMSHEIRTPMNGVIGMSDLLSKTDLTPQQADYVRVIVSSAKALLVIINDILDFSKIEAGKLELHAIDFSLRELIHDIEQVFLISAQSKEIFLRVDVQPNIPDSIHGDSDRLRQIISNLLSNAIKFTEKGGVTFEVALQDESEEALTLIFSVTDTGIGLTDQQKKRILQPFTQADSSISRRFGGTGLGLVICKRLSEMFGGDLQFESKWQEGSRFYFTATLEKNKTTPIEHVLPAPRIPKKGCHILLAEDNQVNQMITQAMIEELGHTVDIASDGKEALRKATAQHYDLVLMDIQMPEMDGIDASIRIRNSATPFASVPLIALTANALEEDKDVAYKAGMNGYLSKPFTTEDLQKIIDEFVG